MKITIDPYNATHDGKVVLDFYEDVTAAYVTLFSKMVRRDLNVMFQVEISATLNENSSSSNSQGLELVKTKINGCNVINLKRVNFFVNFFFDHVIKNFNQNLRKCPIKKVILFSQQRFSQKKKLFQGSYIVVAARERVKNTAMMLPPFIKTGQEVFISFNLKVVMKGILRDLCTIKVFFKVIE